MSRMNQPHRRDIRNEDANERQEVRNSRTPQQQLAHLDTILGKGLGATKERARLQKQIGVSE